MTIRRLALIGALLLLPIAALAHLKVGPGAVGIPTGGGAPGTAVVLCQSAVAVSHTGDLNETVLATCTVPANAMGPNGRVEINSLWSNNNNANNKISRVRLGGLGGTIYAQLTQTTNISARHIETIIANRNAANSQIGFASAATAFVSSAANVTSAIDTAAATTIVLTGQLGLGTDTMTLESYVVTLLAGN